MDLTAEYLTVNDPFVHYVNQQKYCNVSMLTPNSFPMHKRTDEVKNQQVYGIKLHGCFSSEEELRKQSEKLQQIDKLHDIFPCDINGLHEFDVDINDDVYKNSKIVYREERLNKCLNNEFVNDVMETEEEQQPTVSEPINFENIDFSKFDNSTKFFNFPIEKQNYACVFFYTDKMCSKFPHLIKGKKIPLFRVLGFFEKMSDAQQFVYFKRNEYPFIFTFEVGKWCAFDIDILKNCDGTKLNEKTQSLNNYKKLFIDILKEEGMEEKERKERTLNETGAKVVTGQYNLENYDMSTKNIADEKIAETKEERLKRELEEINKEKNNMNQQQKPSVKMSVEEFNKNLLELQDINNFLNT
jgi:Family of unknown function (DUF5832)